METPEFIKKIDWSELRKQKSTLIGLMNTCTTVEEAQTLEGLLSFIDATQDYAVDVMGMSSHDVFDFEQEDVREGYTGIETTMSEEKTKEVYLCPKCNSDNVQGKYWVGLNDMKVDDCVDDGDESEFCMDCGNTIQAYSIPLLKTAHVVGFQVVGLDGTSNEGNIHPMMDASFCIYSLSQAKEMLEVVESDWRLLTIWHGDVEEPTMMFSGNPRD